MNVIDSSAWIEYFVKGPNAAYFGRPLRDSEQLLVPSIAILEVYKWVLRKSNRDEALRAAAIMRQGRVVDLTESLAMHAAELGLAHRLPLADSIIYATAQMNAAVLWTQDSDFEGLDGVRFKGKDSV